ncbi:hypothetical protein AB0O57_22365 [Streptomyces sp. NPDC091201]|uniref:hypothetical protein n=1 Tax=Streptomyces sp. NPDC091201 TaxID=3155190 RepID=UPI00343FC157
MERISTEEMSGGRHLVYVAYFEVSEDDISEKWGKAERFEDEWDLGPRRIFCWRLSTGSYVSLNRVEREEVPGFGFYVRTDTQDPHLMNSLLQEFIKESHLPENLISEKMF